MKILSIDTSSSICSVALLDNDNLIDEINLDNGMTHSENLMPIVANILKKNELELKEIELISVSCGPGSFTGIRIGVASVKAMTEVHNIPVAEITSLELLARNDESDKNKIVLIDAKNDQVYAGVFDKQYNLLEDYMADDINNVIEKVSKYKSSVFIGTGAILHKDLISKIDGASFIEENLQSAFRAGQIGYKKYLENNLKNADTVMPIYLRKSRCGENEKMIEILEMNLDDYEQIKDVLTKEFDEFWKPSVLESELKSENSKYIVAKENGNIVGFAGLWFSPVDAEITNIVTKKTERKRGIAKLLLDRLIEMTKEANKDNISLEVNENNVPAKKLYEAKGFEIAGVRKNYYNGKENAIIMTKYL